MAETKTPPPGKGRNKGGKGISKVYLGLPLWAWLGLGVGAFILIRAKMGGTTSSSAANNPTNTANGTQGPNSIFFLPNGAQPQPQGVSVNVNPRSKPDYYNAQGKDVGQYRYGADELSYLQSNIGNFGLTQAEYTDVSNAYAQIVQKYGQGTANDLHYSWIGPGNVQGLPRQPATSGQAYNGLP